MSFTTTITQQKNTQNSVYTLTLRVYSPEMLRRDLSAFLIDLKASTLISKASKKDIEEWESIFFKETQSLNTDEERENVCNSICFIICDIIRHEALQQNNSAILAFEAKLKLILARVLPSNTDVERFIETYQNEVEAAELSGESFQQNEIGFQESLDQLDSISNDINKKMKTNFELFQKEFKATNQKVKQTAIATFKELDSLTKKVELIAQTQFSGASGVREVGDKLKSLLIDSENAITTILKD